MPERRSEPRQRSLLGGKLILDRRQCTMDCLVRNVSAAGALIVFPQTSLTPSEFILSIPYRRHAFVARVVWRRADRAGLTLQQAANDPDDRQTKRLRMLEAENRRLRQLVHPSGY